MKNAILIKIARDMSEDAFNDLDEKHEEEQENSISVTRKDIVKALIDLEKELECPVCLETAYQAPIYKCIYDHLMF